MKVIRWTLGRLIILLDFIFSPKPILRDKTSQDLVNTMLEKGLDKESIDRFMNSEGFNKEMFNNE